MALKCCICEGKRDVYTCPTGHWVCVDCAPYQSAPYLYLNNESIAAARTALRMGGTEAARAVMRTRVRSPFTRLRAAISTRLR